MKSKFLIFSIVLIILFGITCVFAADNQTEMVSQAPEYHSFAELNQSISESDSEFNVEHDYKYEGDEVNISINKVGKFTINGNNHVLDGVVEYNSLSFGSTDVVTIKNLTFQNFVNTTVVINSPVIFENVKFINCTGSDLSELISANNNTQFINCLFSNNSALTEFIHCEYGEEYVFKNTLFCGGNFKCGSIFVNRCALIVENCTFENFSSISAPAFIYKGENLTVKRSKFLNLNSRLSGGAIIGKFFPKENGCVFSFFI